MSHETRRRVLRTALQLVAGGALFGLTDQLARDVPTAYASYVILVYTLLVTVTQNLIEDRRGSGILVPREPEAPQPGPALAEPRT